MSRSTRFTLLAVALVLVIGGGLFAVVRNFARHENARQAEYKMRPRVTLTRPAADAERVVPVTGIVAEITIPTSAGVDPSTLAAGVTVVRERDGQTVPALANTTGAGDAIIIKPLHLLDPGERYTFNVTEQLKDTSGASFVPYSMSFRVATDFKLETFPAAFKKVKLDVSLDRNSFTALALGPDGSLYAGTFAGMIMRYKINADGTLTALPPIATVLKANHGPRLVTGIQFDPKSTAAAPVLWVSHGQFVAPNDKNLIEGADDWTGKISRISGSDLSKYQDVVVNLPRAWKDHLNFQLRFGPDGAIYFDQGSHTSNGAPDRKWGFRPERKLSGAMLRLDVSKIKALPLDVKTEEGGTYDPAAPDAPLTLYATGVRSGYSLLWHSNGHLYTAVNGAAGNDGHAPASPDGTTPGIANVKATMDDVLLDVKPGFYYGQPNPTRGQYALMGANPTDARDPEEVPEYPVGVQPDPNYHLPAFVFGKNYSANGLIEYHAPAGSDAKANSLDGFILTTRYSDGDDILALRLDSQGRVVESIAGLNGCTEFSDPLDLIEDPKTGNIYVAEYKGRTIALLKPVPGGESHAAWRIPNTTR